MAEQTTIRVDRAVRDRAKAKAQQEGYKLGRLAERLLDAWTDGRIFFGDDCRVEHDSKPEGDPA